MKEVMVYKLGLDMYGSNAADKNGGLYEYSLVKNRIMHIVKKYRYSISRDVLFILNGNPSEGEQERLLEKCKGWFKVFIITDYFAFEKNKEMIEASDLILHQSMSDCIPVDYDKPIAFSYVPYLFYRYPSPRCINSQNGLIIFGGANTGRDDKFNEYIMKDEGRNTLKAFTKIYNPDGTVKSDTRIPYDKFMKEMRDYSYALMITRKEYTRSRWFTPRFVEAVSNWVLPIVDVDYPLPYDIMRSSMMVVNSYDEMRCARNYFNTHHGKDNMLSYLTDYIASKINKFDWLIYQILLGFDIDDIFVYND